MDGVIDSGGSSESMNELAWNAIGAGVIIGYYILTSTLLFLFIEKIGWYRVTPEDQDKGLDFIKHDDAAYHFGTLGFVYKGQLIRDTSQMYLP